ncbi:isoprenylcysteine carboxylmethyltransferase family protein [Streptomyces triticagri]|uniref:Isoprenylcysteine carboxylmethyltransferase family protein n=1 Tax=Streptomyces triticagri TaxID=2293568 RepID=A0A372M319_9ACTN|nr:isoprenylcysteine carboxylmethyltransferase family protein [Streptomyces triticagri]RFU84707.1 isoprenylcysteine carboxylmethyltransferase family protein [Streptomyces triticagri]
MRVSPRQRTGARTLRAGPLAVPFVVAGVVPTVLGPTLAGPALDPAVRIPVGLLLALVGAWSTADAVDRVYLRQNTPLGDRPPDHLVTGGSYRILRNPMAAGMTLLLLGESLLWSAASIAGWAAVVLTVSYVTARRIEEPGLLRTFGAAYTDYRRAVPAWFPLPRRTRELRAPSRRNEAPR